MLKRVASLLFCALFVVTSVLLVGCSTEEETGPDNASVGTEISNEVPFQNEALNWGGETVNILGYNGEFTYYSCQIDAEEPSEEPVANACYNRNSYIKETYGIDINLVLPESSENPIQLLRDDISSGLSEYQAIVNAIHYIAPLASDALLIDFKSVDNDYLHLDQPWWDQTMITDVQINDRIFFLTGDALLEDDEATWAIYFNKDLVEAYGLEDPYELVESGAWNLDKMYEMAKQVNVMTGSTKVFSADSEDVWGLIAQSYDYYLFMQGCEQPMVDNTGDVPTLRVMEEENVSTFKKIASFYINDPVNVGVADYHGRWNDTPSIYDVEKQIFANGNALFMPGSISYVGTSEFKNSDVNYGILPMPKRGDVQENYSTGVNTYHAAVFAIPISNVDKLDATCYALEAMAYYGNTLVVPEYYTRTLTRKKFTDVESEAMLKYIFDNRTYDLGSVYNFHNGNEYIGTLYFYTNLLGEKSDDINSKYASVQNVFQAGIDKLVAACYN